MSSEWQTAPFSKFCDITRGASPRPIHDYLSNEGMPWIKIADATAENSRFISSTKEKIKLDGVKASVKVFPEDLILSNSATPGLPKFLKIEACIHDGWMLLRNFRDLDSQFAYWLLLNERPRLVAQGNGSVFTNLKTEILKSHIVTVPPLSIQNDIAAMLNNLDDRITLLRETNATLEAIAQTLFKSWFMDFDPVRAKSEGKPPEGMNEATAALFPDAFEETELGMVPRTWQASTLSSLATFQNGYAFKGSDWVEQGHPVIKIGNVKPLLIDFEGCSYVSPETVSVLDRFKLGRGDLLVGMTGYVGETGLVTRTEVASYLNQRVGRIVTSQGLDDLGFVFAAVRQAEFKAYAESQSHGSAQANVSGADLMKFAVVVPSAQVLNTFNQVVGTLIEKILANYEEAKTLANLRDTLLPRLISGQLRIADAEVELEKVTA
jgi:type I restriction enzyme S subunit